MKEIYICPACCNWQIDAEDPKDLLHTIVPVLNEHWTECLEKQIEDLSLRLL